MKYGVLIWKETDNIGDDIQSYASSRFLPQIDYYVEREKLDTFFPTKKEEVAVIMNAWYLHNKQNFPPSDYIVPHLVSMHFSTGDNWTIEKSLYLQKYGKDYLNKNGPVGARDFATRERLTELGIDNYFSGCMTLTLEKFENVKKGDYICSVDLGEEKNNKLRNLYSGTNQEIIYVDQSLDPEKNSRITYAKRFENIENLLKLYQGAKAIITTRLHCALPCLALGLPVILIYNKDSFDRLASFKNLMTMYTNEEFLEKVTELNYSRNDEEINKIRNPLIDSCKKFIDEVKDRPENKQLLEIEEYTKVNRIDYIKWKEDIMSIEIKDKEKDLKWFRNYQKDMDKAILQKNDEIAKLEQNIVELKKELENKKLTRKIKNIAKKMLKKK